MCNSKHESSFTRARSVYCVTTNTLIVTINDANVSSVSSSNEPNLVSPKMSPIIKAKTPVQKISIELKRRVLVVGGGVEELDVDTVDDDACFAWRSKS